MNQTEVKIENQIETKKKVFLFLHNDGFNGKDLEPLLLIDNEKIYTIMIKKKYPFDMYYFFDAKKYLKMWNDSKGNILTFINNWSGDLFIQNEQTIEYLNDFTYTAGSHELICENRNGQRKKLLLEGFDIIPIAINEFTKYETAIFYILCTKLS